MRRFMLAAAITVASSTAPAQGVGARAAPQKMTQEEATVANLTRLEELWAQALVRRDRATFERTLAPKFVHTRNDRMIQRPEYLNMLLQGDGILTAQVDSVEVQAYGNIGVVTGWRIVAGRTRDGGYEYRYRFTDTWMPRSGTWQMLASHEYVAPPAIPKK
jgi:hypothetical protein